MALVEVQELVKVYPGGVRAVDGISFSVEEGGIFGFLGPNGAGKTTTIRVIVTLLRPSEGRVTVDGIDVLERPEEVRRRIGYAAQFIGVDDDLTGRENLVLQGRLPGLDRRLALRRADELLEVFDLGEAGHRRAGTFSGGMRRRLDLAQALVHQPRLVLLDEPTTGLDPQTRRALWDHLRELSGRGVTIFLTTQYLEEADQLAGRLVIIDQGRLVAEGSPDALKDELGGDVVTVTLPADAGEDLLAKARDLLADLPGSGEVRSYDHSVSVFTPDAGARVAEIVRRFDGVGISLARLELAEPTLDDVFLRYTGSRMRVEEVRAPSRMLFGRRVRR
ncbi:MAG: ATP-binding cassette domain-containing protein [Actinomycetota bacterium]|nr:ATP-binding cassette domain-containing protein [Actinomycetota bacterium]